MQRLEELCLNSIKDNFTRYISSTAEKLEFLKRKYAAKLLNGLAAKNKVSEEIVDILVSQRLTFLDASWFVNCSWDKVTEKIAEIGHNVEEMFCCFHGESTKSAWQDLMRYLPNLKIFRCHIGCDDSLLQNIALFCNDIEEIDVGFDHNLIDMKKMCKDKNGRALCTKLKTLSITLFFLEDLEYLVENSPSLNELFEDETFSDVLILREDLETHSCYFQSLNMHLTEFDKNYLKICCPKFEDFDFKSVNKDEVNYILFYYRPELGDLNIHFKKDMPGAADDILIHKANKMKSLHLSDCSVSLSVLVNSCPYLESLILRHVRVLFEDHSPQKFFSALEVCVHQFGIPESAGLAKLLSSLLTHKLEIKDSDLSSSDLKECLLKFFEKNSPQSINIDSSPIEKEFFKGVFSNCHSLETVDITGSFVASEQDELLEFFKNMPTQPNVII